MAPSVPNILFIQADQLAAPALPAYGHPVVKAPRLDALAAAGAVFENAYCNSPLCAPSRFSMLTARLPSTIGAYDNAAEFPADRPTFVHELRRAGYRTALAGKMHFVGPDQMHGFEERLTTDIYPADFGWTPDWQRPAERQDYFHTMLSVVEADACVRSQQIDFDDEVAFQAGRWLYDAARDSDDRPFFLLASFSHPHDPYTIGEAYWNRYQAADIDLPRVPALAAGDHDPHSRRIADAIGLWDWHIGEDHVRKARRAYYGAISYLDDKVGELLDILESCNLADDTIVIFTSDHGDMLGERGLWFKMVFFEWALRVPLVVRLPGAAPRRLDEAVSLLDIYPTLLDLAGLETEEAKPMTGISLAPAVRGEAWAAPEVILGEYLGEGAAGPLVMIRRGHHKYLVGEDSPPQLFDLAVDPDERVNLAGSLETTTLEAAFAAEAAELWNFGELKTKIVASQRRRRRVFEALTSGRQTAWDFEPRRDASRQYARNTDEVLGDLERRTRLPYRPAPPKNGGE